MRSTIVDLPRKLFLQRCKPLSLFRSVLEIKLPLVANLTLFVKFLPEYILTLYKISGELCLFS